MNLPAPGEEPVITHIRVWIGYSNGAYREYEASHPHDPQVLVTTTDAVAGLGPGLSEEQRREPRVGIMFSGNPAAGGIQVNQAGVL